MAYVFIADDFTGASDTLATLSRAGLRARLFRDMPPPEALTNLDAWGIATNARALGREAVAELGRRLGRLIAAQTPDFLHLKVCSTFDSSAEIGNFAVLAKALSDETGIRDIAVIGGQPSLGRYAAFGTLFARGPDDRIHRIDRHPVMASHPVTPMHEADMLRHLETLGLHGLTLVSRGQNGGSFPRYYDALDQSDVEAAGRDILAGGGRRLVIGASSVAEGWIAAKGATAPAAPAAPPHLTGPILAFAGSRSPVSTVQIAEAKGYARLPINPMTMITGGEALSVIGSWARERLARGESCILFLTADHSGTINPAALAEASAGFVAELVGSCRLGGLVVAGGDTSSAIVSRLEPQWLDYAGTLCPGVPILHSKIAVGDLPLALKGGQMGPIDFFDRARAMLQGTDSSPAATTG